MIEYMTKTPILIYSSIVMEKLKAEILGKATFMDRTKPFNFSFAAATPSRIFFRSKYSKNSHLRQHTEGNCSNWPQNRELHHEVCTRKNLDSLIVNPDALSIKKLTNTKADDMTDHSIFQREELVPIGLSRKKSRQAGDLFSTSVIETPYKTFTGIKSTNNAEATAIFKSQWNFPKLTWKRLKPVISIQKDDLLKLREIAYLEFLSKIRESNGVNLGISNAKYYKFTVEIGNNSHLVKRIIRSRWWWLPAESLKRSNFMWTSVKRQNILKQLCPARKGSFQVMKNPLSGTPRTQSRIRILQRQLGHSFILESESFSMLEPSGEVLSPSLKLYNRIDENSQISTKKGLFVNLKEFYRDLEVNVFDVVPLTFYIERQSFEEGIQAFEAHYNQEQGENI